MLKRKMVTAALVVEYSFFRVHICSSTEPTCHSAEPTRDSQKSIHINPLDRQFVMDAAQGGMAEVSLSQMATQRATSNAVKQYGQRMVRESIHSE